ncbi:MAG: LLM class flavin-dependent oxidoreductase [Gemmatimonadaceae bacterium]|nr:LLM class flavin-dependent oxidoreductase [Gemmatimonadaceae bacterium]
MDSAPTFGLETFGDVTLGDDGRPLPHAQVIRNVVAEAELADEVGVDHFGIGEHHRSDFAVSSPELVLATIAGRTSRITLGSAVTVLSSDDPVRVFQRFSTLNATSNGRAEVILGRGSFTESFPLFGFPLSQYNTLFEERLALYAEILESDRTMLPVNWQGTTRAPLEGQRVFPSTETGHLTTWIGVGGSPQSVVRAADYGFPLMLAIIGGDPQRFLPFVQLYHRTLAQRGAAALPIGIHSHGCVAESDAEARKVLWPSWREMRDRIGSERGWPPTSEHEFEHEIESGSMYAGAPDTVARKIADSMLALGVQRFDMKYSAGPLSHDHMRRTIELYGREVIPRVRAHLEAARGKTATAAGVQVGG